MEQQMTQPDPKCPQDFTLRRVEWYPDSKILDVQCDYVDYTIEYDSELFDRLLPDGEYRLLDEDGNIFARLDKFNNLHFLVEDFKGHVLYRTVYLKPILERIAEDKYHDQ